MKRRKQDLPTYTRGERGEGNQEKNRRKGINIGRQNGKNKGKKEITREEMKKGIWDTKKGRRNGRNYTAKTLQVKKENPPHPSHRNPPPPICL